MIEIRELHEHVGERVTLAGWVETFSEKTGWRPQRIEHVAGGLPFTRYDPITRWIMHGIAEDQGYATDTARDHEYTDWTALGEFADSVVLPAGGMATAA